MNEDFDSYEFTTSEALLQELVERSDDFDEIQLCVSNFQPFRSPTGQQGAIPGCCSLIKLCSGESLIIHRDELQLLLNDPRFRRSGLPVSLVPLLAEPEADTDYSQGPGR